MAMTYETLKQAKYKHLAAFGDGQHLLIRDDIQVPEIWYANKNHASFGIIYKNTHLEFAHSVDTEDAARQLAIDWQQWYGQKDHYTSELIEWQTLFEQLAEKYNLTDEFKENGIL